ncbi:hypothetical protein MKW94_029897 [Papaver nudicaule]|uniref:RING-type domain-containing protein n=1 Tax=Papaver nudicaule TaxID=74823 RepID=A0AA42AQP6_PAPNU|nr:hypothetical protein [Papaver nudicaule]
MKSSSMDVNASVGDDQYYSSEISFCQICIEAKPANEMRNCTDRCTHVYCSECITKHFAANIQENITQITYPYLDCQETLEPHFCRDIIPGQVFDRWENALCEFARCFILEFSSQEYFNSWRVIKIAGQNIGRLKVRSLVSSPRKSKIYCLRRRNVNAENRGWQICFAAPEIDLGIER